MRAAIDAERRRYYVQKYENQFFFSIKNAVTWVYAYFPISAIKSSNYHVVTVLQKARRLLTWSWLRDWCVDWWHSGRDDDYEEEDDQTPSDVPAGISYGTTVSRSTSLNVIHQLQQPTTPTPSKSSYHAVNNNNRLANRSLSNDSVSGFTRFLPALPPPILHTLLYSWPQSQNQVKKVYYHT